MDDPLSPGPSSPGDDAFRTLALRLLGQYGYAQRGPLDDSVQLVPGRVADEFPPEIPIPEGSRVLGSLVSRDRVTVVLDSDRSCGDIEVYYMEHLEAAG